MAWRSRSNRFEGDSEPLASIRIRASRTFVHGFVHRVGRAQASSQSSRRASLRAACALDGALQKWVCARAGILRLPELAFVRPPGQSFERLEDRAAST